MYFHSCNDCVRFFENDSIVIGYGFKMPVDMIITMTGILREKLDELVDARLKA